MREYQDRLAYFATQLERRIRNTKAGAVDVSFLFYLYSFDVMSDLAFGEPLNMLESDEHHFVVGLLRSRMNLLGPLSPVPWLVRVGYSIPGVAQRFKDLLTWSAKKFRHRLEHEPKKIDVMSWLIQASRENANIADDYFSLLGDSFALVVADSDTVASTLVSIFYHLAEDPIQMQKLRREISPTRSPLDLDTLGPQPHLHDMINEALRLHPALPSGGHRQTPPEGLIIGDKFIPGNVVVSAPRYSLG